MKIKFRRRDVFATASAVALSAIWAAVVFFYSVGVDRQAREVSRRVADVETRLDSLLPRLRRLEDAPASSPALETSSAPSVESFRPRVLGVGTTKSLSRWYKYVDIEVAPSNVQRRYIPGPMFNPSNNVSGR